MGGKGAPLAPRDGRDEGEGRSRAGPRRRPRLQPWHQRPHGADDSSRWQIARRRCLDCRPNRERAGARSRHAASLASLLDVFESGEH
jgi:hypothetical protein